MLTINGLENIDELVKRLTKEKNKWMSLAIAIDLADEVLKVLLPNKSVWQDQLNRDSQNTGTLPQPLPLDTFKNQKQVKWFNAHPESASARSAFKLFRIEDCALESNFFWFSESATKQKIAAATGYSQNWEDSELTRKPQYKVGIDFFLTPDTNSLMIVLSNHQKLRVLELHGHLSNTQKLIFKDKLDGAAAYTGIENGIQLEFEPQRTIHTTLWNALQLKEVNKQFYGYIAVHFKELVDAMQKNGKTIDDSKQFSSRLLGRLLFVWFLRKMDIINENIGYFETDSLSATEYYDQKLKTLFFKTLNTEISDRFSGDLVTPYLNGGLFEEKDNDFAEEILNFPDGFFTRLYDHFDEFNFTTDESSADFELIAVDPEMLGQVFESLLAAHFGDHDSNERNNTGSFYTPRDIVGYMVKETLRQYLYSKLDVTTHKGIDELLDLSDSQWLDRKSTSNADVWGVNSKKVISEIKIALDNFKVIDPATGSGAFPMGMLQQLLKTYERIETRFDPYKLKLSIIENNIFGVDIQPMAVEISRLRAWLSVIVDDVDKNNIKPLPNLEFKFIAANSLVKLESGQGNLFTEDPELDVKLQKLRNKYFNARKSHTKKEYQRKYYKLTTGQGSMFEDERTIQLKSFDPFKNRKSADFFDPHVMFGVTEGFDAVIGNPPYLQEGRAPKKVFENISYYHGKMDLWYSFTCIGIDWLNENGILCFIAKNNWVTNYGSRFMRNKILEETTMKQLIDFSDYMIFDSADIQTMILMLKKEKNLKPYKLDYRKIKGQKNSIKYSDIQAILRKNQGKNDLLCPTISKEKYFDNFFVFTGDEELLNKIMDNAYFLEKSEITQGIVFPQDKLNHKNKTKLGNNFSIGDGIFLLSEDEVNNLHLNEYEKKILRPFYDSSQIKYYWCDIKNTQWVIYTDSGFKREDSMKEYPNLKKHLDKYQSIITSSNKPYGLHRSRDTRFFKNEKIVATRKSVGRPKFTYINFDSYVSQTYNVIKSKRFNLKYLTGLFNSKLMTYWLLNRGKMQGNNFQLDTKPILNIPIKEYNNEMQRKVIMLVNELLTPQVNKKILPEITNQIDILIYQIYDLNKNEISTIENAVSELEKIDES